ncbi:TetR/AcrR family transcriptional regulator C-terminal domain-containing protein [Bacillus inaquosorum]|uniref:TetR/AcrR family transcriptional regulator C-terminal domain-containing protein n=2 Tax=Bacillus inaquosorum TaxID=483913 RepID=A0A9Q4HW79_9BACI|nr:TetR/AcrR family transcriptional regulator C-terminal domain-containing protein [Bacillus inaquosorum]MCY7974448.1 TetR/AcrR family transcriptional regulator C-terminal domain-containing protein [Bacillus inaquosorum]MCY8083680.1 TetR/AcrR family transcriptional regulator C-terminal domain-containing protein [Bacillus inaquosorum]MCY8138515.1 TetR/AcrR family transcriptional regulator C-terminal domain-containing protein [Bacillus inaquosorum]MCY8169656.1 TetR/AcrR family transcriptional reg
MMNNFENVNNRRTRPAKSPLSRDIIIRTAYKLLSENGISGMSMRKVAKALDTGPASLYVYVDNYQKLSSDVLDYALRDVQLIEGDTVSWKDAIIQVLKSYFITLVKTPGLAELTLTTTPNGSNSMDINECLLRNLQAGGISPRGAAWGLDILLLYASSIAVERSRHQEKDIALEAMRTSYNIIDKAKYPMISMLNSELFSGDGDERFVWGIEVILQGILSMKK